MAEDQSNGLWRPLQQPKWPYAGKRKGHMHTILQALCLAHQLLEVLHLVPASAHRRSRRSSTFPAAAPPRWLAAALSVRVPRRQRAWPVLSSAPGAARLRPAAPLLTLPPPWLHCHFGRYCRHPQACALPRWSLFKCTALFKTALKRVLERF